MRIRLMPGQVVVRENRAAHYPRSIVIPDTAMADERSRQWHRGQVIAMGPPSRTSKGVEVPPGFAAGDEVIFSYRWHQQARTRPWPLDGQDAVWLTQEEIHAVVERDR